jgi:hypothetical protein
MAICAHTHIQTHIVSHNAGSILILSVSSIPRAASADVCTQRSRGEERRTCHRAQHSGISGPRAQTGHAKSIHTFRDAQRSRDSDMMGLCSPRVAGGNGESKTRVWQRRPVRPSLYRSLMPEYATTNLCLVLRCSFKLQRRYTACGRRTSFVQGRWCKRRVHKHLSAAGPMDALPFQPSCGQCSRCARHVGAR